MLNFLIFLSVVLLILSIFLCVDIDNILGDIRLLNILIISLGLHLPFNRYTLLTSRSTPQTVSDSAVFILIDPLDTSCNIQHSNLILLSESLVTFKQAQ